MKEPQGKEQLLIPEEFMRLLFVSFVFIVQSHLTHNLILASGVQHSDETFMQLTKLLLRYIWLPSDTTDSDHGARD